ncbi:hypothetical protein EDC01DRAFT_645536 [Geopyxis carbonaria]|nr:hypothetical protein EDC01DRAFT_645536 [Geopyxis carbonaria]
MTKWTAGWLESGRAGVSGAQNGSSAIASFDGAEATGLPSACFTGAHSRCGTAKTLCRTRYTYIQYICQAAVQSCSLRRSTQKLQSMPPAIEIPRRRFGTLSRGILSGRPQPIRPNRQLHLCLFLRSKGTSPRSYGASSARSAANCKHGIHQTSKYTRYLFTQRRPWSALHTRCGTDCFNFQPWSPRSRTCTRPVWTHTANSAGRGSPRAPRLGMASASGESWSRSAWTCRMGALDWTIRARRARAWGRREKGIMRVRAAGFK